MSRRTVSFFEQDHAANRPGGGRPSFRRNNTNAAGNSGVPKPLAGQPLKKTVSDPVSLKTKEKLGSFAHKNASAANPLSRSKTGPAGPVSKYPVTSIARPNAPPGNGGPEVEITAPLDSSPPPIFYTENKHRDERLSVKDKIPSDKVDKTPAPKKHARFATGSVPTGDPKDVPCTPQHRFALNDLLSQANTTPSVSKSTEEASPEVRVSWRNSPKRLQGRKAADRVSMYKKRARSSSPATTPRPSKRAQEQLAFDISSSALKTPMANPFEDAWSKRLQDFPKAGVSSVKGESVFDGSSPSAPPTVCDSPSAFRRSLSAPTKRLKLAAAAAAADKPKETDNLEARSIRKLGRRGGATPRNPANERVSSLLARLQENTKVAALQKSETAPASINSSLYRYDDASASIENMITPPVDDKGPWERESSVVVSRRSRSVSVMPPGNSRQTTKEPSPVPVRAEEPKSDDYGLDDDDDDEMFELVEGTCQPDEPAQDADEADEADEDEKVGESKDNDDMDYGLDDLDDDDDWEADIAKAVKGDATPKPSKNKPKSPLKKSPASSKERVSSPIAILSDDDYGSDFDPDEIVKDTKSRTIQRFVVLDVFEDDYISSTGQTRQEKALRVEDEKTRTERRVLLRQAWVDCDVREGDVVNVIGGFDVNLTCIIDNSQNMLILHPDILLSATAVADSFDCIRLATLKERVKAISDASQWSVYGNILHEVFQVALSANDFSTPFLEKEISRILSAQMGNLYAVRVTPAMAVDHLRTQLPYLQDWAKLFVSAKPKPDAMAKGHRSPDVNIAIRKVLDVEEHIWSPKFGLKGNIDVTVEADVRDINGQSILTLPLELKTGRNAKVAHRAQTMLYTLLMSDRYDIESLCGVLYYMEKAETIRVPNLSDELRGLMIGRNHLARYIYSKLDLPPMLQDKRMCGRCYAKTTCFVYHKTMENGTEETSGVGDVFTKEAGHLNQTHSEFFSKWEVLLSKEEKDMEKFRKELWVMSSEEREAAGRCFGDLKMIPESAPTSNDNVSKINRYHYRFVKRTPPPSFSFLESQIGVGEAIVISDEAGHFALAKGFVIRVSAQWIMVAVDRRLHNSRVREPGFHETKNQTFSAIMEILEDGTTKPLPPPSSQEGLVSYRLDKDEFSNGMALIRNNLVELVKADGNPRLREVIVELAPPVYNLTSTAYPLPSASQGKINIDQKNAIEKVMSAQDYALVLGMPGTGKTTTIAHIIRALVHQGKTVLLTSYTHTAVDNILLKIKDDPIKVLRLGATSKIHPEVQKFAVLANAPKKSFDEIQDAYHSPQVVATTCLSINHVVFTERVFDYCIVDEASQITLPVCVGPIRMAKKFVLVGDHFQLPPLVRSPEAKAGGLDVSLFKLLSDAHPDSVVNLEHQYRMCEDIMALSNHLIYEGRLKCGTEKVAKSSLHIPNIQALEKFHKPSSSSSSSSSSSGEKMCGDSGAPSCWIKDLLKEDVKARFLNTDLVAAPEEKKGDRTYNPIEAELTRQLVEGFLHCGVDANEIGVVSVYRSQIKAIQHLLHAHPSVEMHTADKFQGRDKDCIIISLVRSNDKEIVGELLKDWRRINVAFTRAKTKLLIIGSKSTLKTNELLAKFVEMMEEREWVYDLPHNAHLGHDIPVMQGMQSPTKGEQRRGVESSRDGENRRPVTVQRQQRSLLDMLGKKGGGGVLKLGGGSSIGPRSGVENLVNRSITDSPILGSASPDNESDLFTVDEELSLRHYRGLPSHPILIATTKPGDYRRPWGAYPNSARRELHAAHSSHPVIKVWETGISEQLRKGLNEMNVNWTSIDIVHTPNQKMDNSCGYGGPPVDETSPGPAIVWIGVETGSLSFVEGAIVAANCQNFITRHNIPDCYVEIRESRVVTNARTKFMKPPGDLAIDFTERDPFLATLSLPICATNQPDRVGSGGFYISAGGDDKEIYLVTARHVVLDDGGGESGEDEVIHGRNVSILGNDQFVEHLADLDAFIANLDYEIIRDNEMMPELVENHDDEAKRELEHRLWVSARNLRALRSLRQEIATNWGTMEDRVIGQLVWAPPIHFSTGVEDGHTLDLVVVKMDSGRLDAENYHGNTINLTRRYFSAKVRKEIVNLHPSETSSIFDDVGLKNPSDFFVPLKGQTPATEFFNPSMMSADGDKCTVAFKHGGESGISFGRAIPVPSYTRRFIQGVYKESKEWGIIGQIHKYSRRSMFFTKDFRGFHFSEIGDSGACVADAYGRVSGIITSGACSGRKEDGGLCPETRMDVTYVTPITYIMKALHGSELFKNAHLGPTLS
ncbi:Tripartite DNA replication factor [Arthrobotrys megalospora]